MQHEADPRQLAGAVGCLHILAGTFTNVTRDLAAQDVLDKDLGGVVGWGWSIKGNHISGCSGTCITKELSSRMHPQPTLSVDLFSHNAPRSIMAFCLAEGDAVE